VQTVSVDSAVIEIGGVGLQVFIPAPLLDNLRVGEHTALQTHLVVREDSLTLYGFGSAEARETFVLLLGVNGIGPRLALAILSSLEVDAIRRAVFHEQAEVFSQVPGVGKKTSQKILLHLQDRIPGEAGYTPVRGFDEADSDVLEALTALGYSVVEAQAALQSIPADAPQEIEDRLRLALAYFS
jgi:Holliday junction DNA helicase RuvA